VPGGAGAGERRGSELRASRRMVPALPRLRPGAGGACHATAPAGCHSPESPAPCPQGDPHTATSRKGQARHRILVTRPPASTGTTATHDAATLQLDQYHLFSFLRDEPPES